MTEPKPKPKPKPIKPALDLTGLTLTGRRWNQPVMQAIKPGALRVQMTPVTPDEALELENLFDATYPEYTRRAAWRLREDLLREHGVIGMQDREPYTSEQDSALPTAEPNGTDER